MTRLTTTLHCTLYRAHHPGWAWAPTSGEGAKRHGGRFNRKGKLALYLSTSINTAWLEAQQAFPFKAQPMTMVAYDVHCDDVLDLTDPAVRRKHRVKEADLSCAWEDMAKRGIIPPSWKLADRLYQDGVAAVIVNSYAWGASIKDINVVFWRWGKKQPHRVKAIDDEDRLPRDQASWE